MLVLNLATHRRWKMLKADAKSAFLQLTAPNFELAERLGLPVGQAVCLLEAACGQVVEQRCGLQRLTCEPCIWVTVEGGNTGMIGALVDDFLISGDESNARWVESIRMFGEAVKWSLWEVVPFTHCGVGLSQPPA